MSGNAWKERAETMKVHHIHALYFSPTGGTKKVITALARKLSALLHIQVEFRDLTVLENRRKVYQFDDQTLVLLAIPVYAGRIPNKLLPDLQQCIKGNHTPVIPICVYGNRSYDEALRELLMLSETTGFIPIGAATMVSQHAFSNVFANGRPNMDDISKLEAFAMKLVSQIQDSETWNAMDYDRKTLIKPYYMPLKEEHTPAKFLKAKPVTDISKCNGCGICAQQCPMASISLDNVVDVCGICIKCQACVVHCPTKAKHFIDEDFLSHVRMLEATYKQPKEPEFFLSN